MQTKVSPIQLLQEKRDYLRTHFSVSKLGVFGSVAKDKVSETSDIDIVVEFDQPVGFQFMELADYLENLLGRKVDLLTPAGIQTSRSKRVAKNIKEVSSMSKRTDIELLNDIREAILRIESYVYGYGI